MADKLGIAAWLPAHSFPEPRDPQAASSSCTPSESFKCPFLFPGPLQPVVEIEYAENPFLSQCKIYIFAAHTRSVTSANQSNLHPTVVLDNAVGNFHASFLAYYLMK